MVDTNVEFIQFRWSKPTLGQGFIWANDALPDKILGSNGVPPFLIKNPKSTSENLYTLPFDETGDHKRPLFVRFADLEPTKEAIMKFANEHGWLGIGENVIAKRSGLKEGQRLLETGESLSNWNREIMDIRIALNLFKLIESEDEVALSRAIRWESNTCVRVRTEAELDNSVTDRRDIFLHKDLHPDLFFLLQRKIQPLNVFQVAPRAALLLEVNKKLQGTASPHLLLNRHGELQCFMRPHNLLAALWVQLYQIIQGQRKIRICAICGNWMDITGSRTSKYFHTACRKKKNTYRLRQKKQLDNYKRKLNASRLLPEQRENLNLKIDELLEKLK